VSIASQAFLSFYATRRSTLLLVALGIESVTPTLVIGAALIVMAVPLSRSPSW
jgi:hypothetical protein